MGGKNHQSSKVRDGKIMHFYVYTSYTQSVYFLSFQNRGIGHVESEECLWLPQIDNTLSEQKRHCTRLGM